MGKRVVRYRMARRFIRNFELKVHYGQNELAAELADKIGDGCEVIP